MKWWSILSAVAAGGLVAGGGALLFKNRKVSSQKVSDLPGYPNLALGARICKEGKPVTQLTDGTGRSAVHLQEGESVTFDFEAPVTLNTVLLRELLTKTGSPACPLEGAARQFSIYALLDGAEKLIYRNDKIDAYRLCTFDDVSISRARLQIDSARGAVHLALVAFYCVEKKEQPFRLHDYFVYQEKYDYRTEVKFGQYLDFITDMTMFNMAKLDETGEIKYVKGKAEFVRRLTEIKSIIGERKIKLYCNMLTGKPDGQALYANRHKIAANLADFVSEFDLEGIEMDWEFPHGKGHEHYNQLILEIKHEFVPIGKKVTLAVAVWNMHFSKAVINAVDYFNVMVYDHGTDDFDHWHATFKHGVYAVERMLCWGYPRQKLCLGIPFYGREIKVNKKMSPIWLDYENSRIRDPWSNVSYQGRLISAGDVETKQMAYYNGYSMVRDKTAYAISMSLGGIMTWHMMEDLPMDHPLSLHKAIHDACVQRLEM